MQKHTDTILFVSTNDGSDMRINKEVKSLNKYSEVIFFGVGEMANCYVAPYCKKVILVKGKRNSIPVLIKQILIFIKLLFTQKIKSIHIINEQLYIFFYPLVFFKHTVLDLFDSIFLIKNKGGEKLKHIKCLLYAPANKIIITDENRLRLMPQCVQNKCEVVPNYPYFFQHEGVKETSNSLTILYNGWMGLGRGTEIVEGLLKTESQIKIIMAGWFSDNYTKDLLKKFSNQINYLGVLPQEQIMKITQESADYILCVYAPVEQNNINASPNKIYDAIQTSTPVIINSEVKISKWVETEKIGYVIPEYDVQDFNNLYNKLNAEKRNFIFGDDLKNSYVWEKFEDRLIKAHKP